MWTPLHLRGKNQNSSEQRRCVWPKPNDKDLTDLYLSIITGSAQNYTNFNIQAPHVRFLLHQDLYIIFCKTNNDKHSQIQPINQTGTKSSELLV